MHVAGANLGPRVGDADDRLVQIFFAIADHHADKTAMRRDWGPRSWEYFGACLQLSLALFVRQTLALGF